MHGPMVSGWLLVTLCGGVGSYCLVGMRSCAGTARGAAGAEALMGFGMAAMAVPGVVFTPPEWTWMLYAVAFGGTALTSLHSARRGWLPRAHHLIGSLTMIYMAVAMADRTAHTGHSTSGVPLLTGVLLAYYTVYVLRSGVRLVPAAVAEGEATPAVRWGTPAVAAACRLTMGLAMLAMLLTF